MNNKEREFGFKGEDPFDKAQQLRFALKRAVENNPADVLLLSGGIDSSILAALDPKTPAITVVLRGEGEDLRNAQRVAERFGMNWHSAEITANQAIEDISEIMVLTQSYDPAIKNDITIYEGLKYAASLGYRTVRTGDAADEWFAGYSNLHGEDFNFEEHVKDLIPQIRLPSSRLARAMGLKMNYPYLYDEVLELVKTFKREDNIARINLEQPGNHAQIIYPELAGIDTWGKIVLRNSAYGLLPPNIIWRPKAAIEFGSGTNKLEEIIDNSITQEEVEEMRQSGKHFWSKYHGKLYLMYRDLGLEPSSPQEGEYGCGWCGGGIIEGGRYCPTCGAWPSNQRPSELFVRE